MAFIDATDELVSAQQAILAAELPLSLQSLADKYMQRRLALPEGRSARFRGEREPQHFARPLAGPRHRGSA